MNKAVNVFSAVVLTVFTLMSMIIIYDLAISNYHLKGMPYKMEILSGLAILFFFIGVLRIRRRWEGYKDMRKFSQFDFDAKVSKAHLNRSFLYTALEIAFMLSALYLFVQLSHIESDMMIVMICVMIVLVVESIIFLFQIVRAGKSFRIGVNSRIIAYFGREMHLFYYAGLRRVELHQKNLVSFIYKDGLVLFFPTAVLRDEDRIPFRDALIHQLEQKNIYFDDELRNLE